jgi:hypothetical protein
MNAPAAAQAHASAPPAAANLPAVKDCHVCLQRGASSLPDVLGSDIAMLPAAAADS